jgi:hypothetical protein
MSYVAARLQTCSEAIRVTPSGIVTLGHKERFKWLFSWCHTQP